MRVFSVRQAVEIAKSFEDPKNFLGLLEIYLLLEFVLEKPKIFLQMNPDFTFCENYFNKFTKLCSERLQGKPVAKIIGLKDFWKDSFVTNSFTLDPRPDSETMIEHVLKVFPDTTKSYKILDLGTGTGCLGLSLIREYQNAECVMVDISEEALKVAGINTKRLGLDDRIQLIQSNWLDNVHGEFDIIVSNPPYIPKLSIDKLDIQVNFDPYEALFGGGDGLSCYKVIAAKVEKICKNTSHIFFEIGEGQETDVAKIMEQHGFRLHSVSKDLSGIIRICTFNLSR